jgi:hypothetical protein
VPITISVGLSSFAAISTPSAGRPEISPTRHDPACPGNPAQAPEIDELIDRASTVHALLRYCGDCRCASIDDCKLLDERAARLDHRALRSQPATGSER